MFNSLANAQWTTGRPTPPASLSSEESASLNSARDIEVPTKGAYTTEFLKEAKS